MSRTIAKSPIWITAAIVALVAATALVAGYGDKPNTHAQAVAGTDSCQSCPSMGTPQCSLAKQAVSTNSTFAALEKAACEEGACCKEGGQCKEGGCCGKSGGCPTEAKIGCAGGQCSLEQETSI